MTASSRTALVALAAVLAGVPAAQANAATASGSATLVMQRDGDAVRILRRSPARAGRSGGIRFPVSRVSVGSTATVTLRGGLTFRAGRRELHVTGLRSHLTRRSATVTGRVAGRRMTLFSARGSHAEIDSAAGSARLRKARVRLSPRAAARIRSRLGVERLAAGSIGTLELSARQQSGASPDLPGSTPPPPEPPVLARPATALDVAGATITWRVRESFIRYIAGGEGTQASDGATGADPEVVPPSDEALVYSFHFPFARGWHDPLTGATALYYTGAVRFGYQAHGIDFRAKEPEVEINGDVSRAIFRFDGRAGSDLGNRRGVLVNLTPGTPTRNGSQISYERMPGRIPEDARQSVFAGFYAAGEEFGWISVSFEVGS